MRAVPLVLLTRCRVAVSGKQLRGNMPNIIAENIVRLIHGKNDVIYTNKQTAVEINDGAKTFSRL
jgi:hypothetical protein